MLLISTDEHIPGFKKLIDAVHEAKGKMVVQLSHAGRQTLPSVTGMPIVGPSALPATPIPEPAKEHIPHELTVDEIGGLMEAFAAAAGRARDAGADGIELQMGHGYLICSFLSPFSNRRTDEYGGDRPGRSRLPWRCSGPCGSGSERISRCCAG